MTRCCYRLAFVCLVLLTTALPAAAQNVGLRVGASLDPDQFFVGGHYETPAIAERIHFRPNIEIGFGQDLTVTTVNFELVYKFASRGAWNVYGGGGPALNLIHRDGDDRSAGGFNILVGAEHREGLFGEIKAGAIDSPNFKITIGWTFH